MSFVKISELPAATQANATDQLETNQDGTSRRLTVAQVATYVSGNLGSPTITGSAVVSTSSTDAALRITQTGTGNALVVEDSANPDSTPFVVNNAGQVMIGRATAPFGSTLLGLEQDSVNTQPPAQDFLKNRAGATVVTGDGTGQLRFWGFDGTSNQQNAAITAAAEGTIATGDVPGRLVFSTRAQSAASVSERMRIDNLGRVGIGTSSPTAILNVVANSTSDAVRVTQTGTGNALVIEDSTNPDSTPFVVNADGVVINGHTAAVNLPDIQGTQRLIGYQQLANNFAGSTLGAASYINLANGGASLVLAQSRNATTGSHTIVNANDTVGAVQFAGSDGAAFIRAASITAAVDGTPGTNDMPGRLVFSTTADGASSPTERMRITAAGLLGLGTSAPTALMDINSDTLRLRTARTPASATAAGNAGDIAWDANYIYVCTATNTWKRAALSSW